MTDHSDRIGARELSLWAINTRELYFGPAKAVIENLARKLAKGPLDEARAVKAFAYWAEQAARGYAKEFSVGTDWAAIFPPFVRRLAAADALAHYREQIEERAAEIRAEAENRRAWTLPAIRAANEAAGHFYFSRETMRFFGDTMASFAPRYEGAAIYIERVRPMRDRDGRDMGGVGKRAVFDPATGHINPAREA